MKIEIEARSIKMLREALCLTEFATERGNVHVAESVKRDIRDLIRELDKHRPLGPDGRHGDLHTETCGCTDK